MRERLLYDFCVRDYNSNYRWDSIAASKKLPCNLAERITANKSDLKVTIMNFI